MSLSDDLDRENGDLEWREYDAEGTNEATDNATPSTNGPSHCVCGVRLTWPQPLGVAGWLWRADMAGRAKAHADCGGGR